MKKKFKGYTNIKKSDPIEEITKILIDQITREMNARILKGLENARYKI